MRLEFRGISKQFGQHQALRDVSVSLPEFQSLAIIGPSGGGKTTLLRIVAGLEIPEAGFLSIDDVPVDFSEASLLLHRRRIGTVFQAYNLFPHVASRQPLVLPLILLRCL